MHKLTASLLFALLLCGCVADQKRDHPDRDVYEGDDMELELYRHGSAGYEVSQLFNTGELAEARRDTSGSSHGLQLNEFYTIEIAEDPLRPTILTPVGYVRRLQEDRGPLLLYEFYDNTWTCIAYLGHQGALYRFTGQTEEFVGRYEIEDAVRVLFHAPSGYGYDAELQDRSLVNLRDPNVAGAEPRARGVSHRAHRQAPPVVVFTAKRAGEAAKLSEQYDDKAFYERENEKLNRIREANHGGYGQDEDYGGLKYKDGNPVRESGSPMKPGDAGK